MFNAILWPVDGSSLSLKPIAAITNLARLTRAKVVMLSVAEPRLYRASDTDSIEDGNAVEAMRLDSARHEVNKVRAVIEQAGIDCETMVLMSDVPGDQIVDTAQRMQCDLIVMATHGKMGLIESLFSKSTTQHVLEKSPVPILIFP